jgi:putative ABC transport system ATP-binding protein
MCRLEINIIIRGHHKAPASEISLEPLVLTQDLVKVYMQGGEPFTALNKINLSVEKGEMLTIMGPSGSGKSTLLNMLGALDKPTSGKIFIDGTDISTLSDNELAGLRSREIGFIFQQFNLIHRMSALGNVELPLAISGAPRSERGRRAKQLLDSVGLGIGSIISLTR